MKTNVTLKLDADLLREVRVLAAEEGRSISALLSERLEAMVRERKAFERARRRALARLREGLNLEWCTLTTDSAGKKHTRARALVEELWRGTGRVL